MLGKRFLAPLCLLPLFSLAAAAQSSSASACGDLTSLKIDGVEVTKAEPIAAGASIPLPYVAYKGAYPAHCRVDGIINRRKGLNGEEYGISFAVASPKRTHGTVTS